MRTNASVSNEHTGDRTRAIATLCRQLNATATRYPGTQLVLSYEVKDHPGTEVISVKFIALAQLSF